jgi:hypothetical protein
MRSKIAHGSNNLQKDAKFVFPQEEEPVLVWLCCSSQRSTSTGCGGTLQRLNDTLFVHQFAENADQGPKAVHHTSLV